MSTSPAKIVAQPTHGAISERGARIAAGRLRITVQEYREHEAADRHWCPRCSLWLPREAFTFRARGPRKVEAHCKLHRVLGERQARRERNRGISYAGPASSKKRERFALTARGAVAVKSSRTTTAEAGVVATDANPGAAAPSGPHSSCPPSIRHLCQGRLPAGWVRASDRKDGAA